MQATACEMLRARTSAAVHHVWGRQEVDVAYEVRSGRLRLCVCGAGPDAAPLVAMARMMGWHVTLIDHRAAMLSPTQWPDVDRTLVRSPADITVAVEEAGCDAAVVMSHHYDRDLEFIAAWLDSPVPYIGMLGPAHRTQQMLARLAGMGVALTGAQQQIRAPVGLDLGGETPEEIALSIVAEIKASVAGRRGGPLRDRQAPIHDRQERLGEGAR